MLLASLALMLASQPAQIADDGRTIVVTARSLQDTEAALRACLARNCPPAEDIKATAAHAENLFVAGRYDSAASVLGDSLGRNKGYARELPEEVAGLYRGHSRISAHLGRGGQYRSSSYGALRALKAGLPENDPRVIGAKFEVATMLMSLGKYETARNAFKDMADQAEDIGRGDLARLGRLRVAWMDYLAGDRAGGRDRLEEMAADKHPDGKSTRVAALILLSRIDRAEGRKTDTDALIAELKQVQSGKPVLLYAPPIPLRQSRLEDRDEVDVTTPLRTMAMDTFEKKWVDVGFWVEADGRVRDLEILRSSGVTDWTKPLLTSIKGRIYAPLKDPGGNYRVERHTYTSLWEWRTGSRMKQRSADARIESLDLSAE